MDDGIPLAHSRVQEVMMHKMAIAAGVLCLMTAVPAGAQSGSATGAKAGRQPPSGKTQAGVAAADRAFAREAAVGGMAEVELGRVAADKASNPDVKQFGQRMVDDHSKANDELKAWASQKNTTLPTELDAQNRALRDRLSKLSGAAFDRAYMRAMVQDHDKDVQAFGRASRTAHDADLKGWAAKTLPTLKDHQKMAHDISSKLGGAAAKPKAKG